LPMLGDGTFDHGPSRKSLLGDSFIFANAPVISNEQVVSPRPCDFVFFSSEYVGSTSTFPGPPPPCGFSARKGFFSPQTFVKVILWLVPLFFHPVVLIHGGPTASRDRLSCSDMPSAIYTWEDKVHGGKVSLLGHHTLFDVPGY